MTTYKLTNPPRPYYASNFIQWNWYTKPRGGKVKAISEWVSCRENASNNVRRDIMSKVPTGFDAKVARILCQISVSRAITDERYETRRRTFVAKIQRAVNFLNVMEKEYGWELTELHDLEFDDPGSGCRNMICMITGDKKWIRSPHMVSLWLLFLRVGGTKHLWNPKSYDSLKKKVSKYLEKVKNTDADHIRIVFPFAEKIMDNYSELFKGFPASRNYSSIKAWDGATPANEGIRKLCTGYSADKKLTERLNTIHKIYK